MAKSSGNSVNMHSSWVPPGATQSFGSWTHNARNWLSRFCLRSELHHPNTNLQSRLASAPSLGFRACFGPVSGAKWSKGQKDTTCTRDHKQHQNHQILDKATAKAMNRDAIFHQFHRAKTQIRIWKLRTTKCLKSCPFERQSYHVCGNFMLQKQKDIQPHTFLVMVRFSSKISSPESSSNSMHGGRDSKKNMATIGLNIQAQILSSVQASQPRCLPKENEYSHQDKVLGFPSPYEQH